MRGVFILVAFFPIATFTERIFAVIKPGNLRSAAVARRIGMQWIERTNRYYGGEELDLFVADRE